MVEIGNVGDEEEEEEEEEEEDEQEVFKVIITLPRSKDRNHPLDVFDLTSLTWSTQTTFGELEKEVPDLGIGSTLSYHKGTHSMYLYGGWNNEKFSSDVYRVSMETWKWEKIAIPDGDIKPTPRYLTGVVIHGDKLCNFGGVGPDIVKIKGEKYPGDVRNQDVGAEYHKSVEYPFGWNNEYCEFDVIESKCNHSFDVIKH